MSFRLRHLLTAWCALLALLSSMAVAQNLTNGAVSGTVTDPTGAVIANATVTLKNRATGALQTTHTNTTGYYTFPFVSPGDYAVAVTSSGFQTVTKNVSVALNTNSAANLQLALTSEQQTVEVNGSAAAVETEDATGLARSVKTLRLGGVLTPTEPLSWVE